MNTHTGTVTAPATKPKPTTKNVVRYKIVAEISGDIEYDPKESASYTAALEQVEDLRDKVAGLGFGVTLDRVGPAKVKG